MAFTAKQRVLALVLTLVGGAAWWQQSGQTPEALPKPVRARLPDYTVEQFTATTMDPNGRPARSLTAREMRHFPDDDSSELDLPVLILNRPDGPPWDIRSETGWISGDRERLLLHGQHRLGLGAAEGDQAEAVLEYADPMTQELLTGLINRDYALFASNFSETLKSGMDAAAMETMAGLLNETLGGYQTHSADTILLNDDHITVVYKITAGSSAVATLRVVFSTEQGHPITGLWLDSPELRK